MTVREQLELRPSQRCATRHPVAQAAVETAHQVRGGRVFNPPQTLNQCRCTSVQKAAAQSDDLIPASYDAPTRLARAQGHQCSAEIQTEDVVDIELSIGELQVTERRIV